MFSPVFFFFTLKINDDYVYRRFIVINNFKVFLTNYFFNRVRMVSFYNKVSTRLFKFVQIVANLYLLPYFDNTI